MYIRTVKSRDKEYVQLAHNFRDPKTGVSKAKILYSFGRKDQLDVEGLERFADSIFRFLDSENLVSLPRQGRADAPFEFVGSRQLGGTWLLNGMWDRLGIRQTLEKLLSKRNYSMPVERMLFALVANRALNPSSKLYMEHWVKEEAFIPGLPEVDAHNLYRAMDFLLEAADSIQEEVFFQVASLFDLEVDLIFLDTTTTYFEVPSEDDDFEPENPEEEPVFGLRKRSKHSKDKRPDLPQAVIAFAVTRTGIPVRCWVWPGNTSDQEVIKTVKKDLNSWRLGRVVMVQDTGFNSEENKRLLQTAGGHYIMGEKLRQGRNAAPVSALSKRGRYSTMDNGLEIKDIVLDEDSEARRRYVLVRNPDEAKRDALKREDIVKEAERRLEELKQLDGEPHEKATCALRSHNVFGKYVRQTKTGKLRLDKAKVQNEAQYDGKYLISTSDLGISAEDVVLGYKQLFEIERVFKDMKHLIDIRPVRHRLDERIRAHVLLCWLGMLLIRIAEQETDTTWFNLKKTLSTLQVGILKTPEGDILQTGQIQKEAARVFEALKIKEPATFLDLPVPLQENL
jgi:transposase